MDKGIEASSPNTTVNKIQTAGQDKVRWITVGSNLKGVILNMQSHDEHLLTDHTTFAAVDNI